VDVLQASLREKGLGDAEKTLAGLIATNDSANIEMTQLRTQVCVGCQKVAFVIQQGVGVVGWKKVFCILPNLEMTQLRTQVCVGVKRSDVLYSMVKCEY